MPTVRKGLIYSHRETRLSPYLPHAWVGRAGTFLTLGYGELATTDAYRGRILCEAISTEACQKWKEGDGSLTDKVVQAIISKVPRSDFDIFGVKDEISVIEEMAWLVMAQGLMCIRAWYDAISVLQDGLKKFPSSFTLKTLLAEVKIGFEQLEKDFEAHGYDSGTVQKTIKRGRVDRVAYPWIVPEELTRSTKAFKKIKAKIASTATKVGIAPSDLGGTMDGNYGVFAKADINKGETILLDKSIYTEFNIPGINDCSACSQHLHGSSVTVDCCKAKFCSESCKAEAVNAYHRILCGKTFSWLHAACKDADDISNAMVPLLMVKVLATAIQQNSKPLKVACVGMLKADYQKQVLSYFTLFDNIIAPVKILQTLGVDIFTDLRFDSWALQTLFLRIENNQQGGTFGKRRYSGINPLFSMFNHDCNPGATWHGIGAGGAGGAIEVAAIRAIKKDDEICVSYVEPWVPEAERRGRILAHIGKVCECGRCVQEREATANGGDGGVVDVKKMRRDVVGAQIASWTRLAEKN